MEIYNRADDPAHQFSEHGRVHGSFTRTCGCTGPRAGIDNCSDPCISLMGCPDNNMANAGNAGNGSPILKNVLLPRQWYL